LPAAKVNNFSFLKTSKICLSEGLWKKFKYLGLQFYKLKGIGKNFACLFIIVWKCVCAVLKQVMLRAYLAVMQWHRLNSLPGNMFSYLHICLFVIFILVRYILLKVLPVLKV